MKYPSHSCVSFCLLVFILFEAKVQGKLYLLGERANPSCRLQHTPADLSNAATLNQIDMLLDDLYDPAKSSIQMNGNYNDPCNDTIEFEFDFEILVADKAKVENDSSTSCMVPHPAVPKIICTKLVKAHLVNLLEAFEIQRDRYEKGLWGYCAREGAEELMANITRVLMSAKSSNNIIMCNRSELLMCHPRYKKCQCIVGNKDFREVASEFWDDTEEMEDSGTTIGRDQCVLNIGSDCPLGDDSGFMCIPKSMCLFKSNKSRNTPCNNLHKNAMDVDTTGRTQNNILYTYSIKDTFTGLMQLKTIANPEHFVTNDSFADKESDYNGTDIIGGIDTQGRMGRVAANTRMKHKERYKRIDYFSNVHCQCYGFVGGKSNLPSSTGLSLKKLAKNKIYVFSVIGWMLKILECNLMQ